MTGIGALLGAELRRFFARRAIRYVFALGIALATLVLVIITVRSGVRAETREVFGPTGSARIRLTADHRLRIHDNYPATLKGVGVAMALVAFALGATFIGAEYGAGSLSTQLLFEPRRVRLVAVKALAVGIGVASLCAVLLVYIGLLQWVGSEWRGVVNGLDTQWFWARVGDIGRVTLGVAGAAIAAYAVTVVARRTVAAVAGLLLVPYVSLFVAAVGHWRWVAQDNPTNALLALIINYARSTSSDGRNNDYLLTAKAAAVASGLWVAGFVVVAGVTFSRREVR